MNLDEYKALTNAQLAQECEDLGIEKVVGSSNPHKPTKDDYIRAISRKLNYEPDEVEEVEEVEEVKEDEIPNTRKPQSKAQLARLDMFRKDRVIIHDMQENQTKDKDEMLPVSWGNRLLGGQTDFVSLNGEPQYVRRGALKNLEDATTVIHEPKPNGNGVHARVVKRFVVTPVAGLTQAELDELATKQRMRNAKYA